MLLLRKGHYFPLNIEAQWTKLVSKVLNSSLRWWDYYFRSSLIWTALSPPQLFRDVAYVYLIRHALSFLDSLPECLQNLNFLGNTRQTDNPTVSESSLYLVRKISGFWRCRGYKHCEILCSSIPISLKHSRNSEGKSRQNSVEILVEREKALWRSKHIALPSTSKVV